MNAKVWLPCQMLQLARSIRGIVLLVSRKLVELIKGCFRVSLEDRRIPSHLELQQSVLNDYVYLASPLPGIES